jgi:Xaa-Pro aminopeptidase
MTNYNTRLTTYQQALDGQADLAFLPISSDLQYLTGIPRDLPNFGAVLHPGAWLEGAWLTPSAGPLLTITRMSAEVGSLTSLKEADVRILGDHDDPAALARSVLDGLDLPESPTVAVSNFAEAETMIQVQRLLPGATFTSATDLLRPQRAIKSEAELALLRKAGEITEAAFTATLPNLTPGMTELDVISEVNYQLRRHGSLGESFVTTMYNSGPNLPLKFGERLETQARRLEPPVTLLFDFGAIYEGYCYDFGRTVFFGEPTAEMERIYELVMASQRAGIAALKAGEVKAAEVDAAARQVIEDGGYGEAFRHRLGHGIGLDVHEPPFLTASDHSLLQPGMCFTVEPSITQYDGFSARVEDIVVVRPGGGEPLTRGFQSLHVVG